MGTSTIISVEAERLIEFPHAERAAATMPTRQAWQPPPRGQLASRPILAEHPRAAPITDRQRNNLNKSLQSGLPRFQ